MYKERFEMVFRVAQRMTSSFEIEHIIETIRDEAMAALPKLREVCLVVIDQDMQNHFVPFSRPEGAPHTKCRLCETGWPTAPTKRVLETQGSCCAASERHFTLLTGQCSEKGMTEALIPIYDGEEAVAFLDATAKEGTEIDEHDLILLKDLTDLATNIIINARRRLKLAKEKLALHGAIERLGPFVPATVQQMVQQHPDKPFLQKQDKDVSILFLDVEDYTLISDRLPRDKLNLLMETHFSAFLDEIYFYGGDINEIAGDGLMVIFSGSPDENAANAVRAALHIHRRELEINRELRTQFEPLVVNMGINSGVASVGMTRFEGKTGTRMTFTATGHTTNLASRIAGAARNGEILMGPETARRLRNRFEIRDKGIMTFKNVNEPVHVYSAAHPRGATVFQPDDVRTESCSMFVH